MKDEEGNKKGVQAVDVSRVDVYWRKYLRDDERIEKRMEWEEEYRELLQSIEVSLARLKDRVGSIESFTYGEEVAIRSEVRWNVKRVMEMYYRLEGCLDELVKWLDGHPGWVRMGE